jgi:tRNA threonylcarbamoyladenosine biosynthesis protein TsaE
VTYTTHSEAQTIDLGRRLARALPTRCVVLLTGNLGAGKTALSKGILDGLGVANPDEVTSPTFTLIHEYERGQRLAYHIDLYRLETDAEVLGLGLDDLFDTNAVVLIEWGERFRHILPADYEIQLASAGDDRTISFEKIGGADRNRTDE